jgi:hypothetical protein
MRLLIYCILLFFGSKSSFAQDEIAQKIDWYGKAKPTTNLFVHFDKNVYSNNEIVYFTGYLIKEGKNPASTHKIMAVALIRNADSTVVIEDKFVVENGLSLGSLTIPDSLLTGNYRLLAYTDKLTNGIPDMMYEQPITIKTNIDPAFKASMKLLADQKNEQKNQNVLVSVTTKEGGFLPKPTTISYKYGNTNIQTKTDAAGQLLINLPKQENIVDPNLYVNLKNVKESSFISMAIPQPKSKAEVKFYPEGGNLVHNVYSSIGWEVKDQQKKPIALKAFLYKNETIIDTIESSTYGIGKFNLYVEKDANYRVKLIHDGLADSTYLLPKALPNGLALTILQAVVQDTLKLSLRTNGTRNLFIRVHNFRETFLSFPFDMVYNHRTVKIPLTALPKGLATITITDSLERPLAERIFFARYDNTERLNVELEKPVYQQRDSVNIKLKLSEFEERGIVSIAVVQNNRLDSKNTNDIESYTYLKNELANLPLPINGLGYKDKNYLEQVLLVKGWRRYTWQHLQEIKANDTLVKTDSLRIIGIATKGKKELIEPITIGTFGNDNPRLIVTADNGHFDLNTPNLIAEEGKKMYLFIGEKDNLSYQIKIEDPFLKMTNTLSKNVLHETSIAPSTILNNAELVIKGNEKAIRLNEVTIKNKIDESFVNHPYRGMDGSVCGDYVCMNNIFNCQNHRKDPNNYYPIVGMSYIGLAGPYKGCIAMGKSEHTFLPLNGLHSQKEFYLNNFKDPQEPAFLSTIFWSYATLLNAEKETTLGFHTSDITGKFKVIVQGITNKDVVYAENVFEVKPKLTP